MPSSPSTSTTPANRSKYSSSTSPRSGMSASNDVPNRTVLNPWPANSFASSAVTVRPSPGSIYGGSLSTLFTPCSNTTLSCSSTNQPSSMCTLPGPPFESGSAAAGAAPTTPQHNKTVDTIPNNRRIAPPSRVDNAHDRMKNPHVLTARSHRWSNAARASEHGGRAVTSNTPILAATHSTEIPLVSETPSTSERSEEHTSELQSRFDLVYRL